MEIRILARQGESIRQISRRTGMLRSTMRRYLRDEEARRYGPQALRACRLDPCTAYLEAQIAKARPRLVLERDLYSLGHFNSHLKGSFVVPRVTTLRAGGLTLDLATANREVGCSRSC